MTLDIQKLRRRVLDISYKHRLSHIGSCLTALVPLVDIFNQNPERFVLSCGHAGLALYVVLEALGRGDAEEMFCSMGIHPVRCDVIDASTGSLGQGITVAVGMAMAGKDTHVLISDGECAEGSVWEALNFGRKAMLDHTFHVYVNANGYSAIGEVDIDNLTKRLHAFDSSVKVYRAEPGLPFLQGLQGHYHQMTKEEYETAIR